MYSSSALQRIQKDCLIYLIHQHGQQLISNRKPGEKSVFSSASQHDWKGFTSVMLFVACNFWQHTCLWLQWICSSMPPFGEEIEEPLKKPLNFLSLRHAQKAQPSRPKPVKVFGAEPDETVSCPVPAAGSGRGKGHRGSAPSLASTVFGLEPEESLDHRAPKVRRKDPAKSVFGEEHEEVDSSSCGAGFPYAPPESDSDENLSDHDFLPKLQSVFSLGWHCVTNFKYATFWKDNIDDPKGKRTVRKYDNTKRSAKAAYDRKNNTGVQRKNGTDPARLEALFKANQCQCAKSISYESYVILLGCPMFSCINFWIEWNQISSKPPPSNHRCRKDLLQTVQWLQRSSGFLGAVLGNAKARSRCPGACSEVWNIYPHNSIFFCATQIHHWLYVY